MPTGDKAQILFVLTSADKTLDGRPIGFYLEECAAPWSELKDYFTVVFASPAGGVAPLDQNSVEHCGDKEARALLDDSKFKYLIKNTHKLSNIKEEDYVAIFVVGGVSIVGRGGDAVGNC
jgi:putative intracellular protease/amidase